MAKLTVAVGIPCSGKSTYAAILKQLGWAVASRDAIRLAVFPTYNDADESVVTIIENNMIDSLLAAGHNVFVDDCNTKLSYIKRFAEIAARHSADFDAIGFPVSAEEAKRRNKIRADAGGIDVPDHVIDRMAKSLKSLKINKEDLEVPKWEPYVPPVGKPKAIQVDIDGVIAKNNDKRGWYDWASVGGDDVQEHIRDLVSRFKDDHVLIFMSGRDESCRSITEEWFDKHNVPWDYLFMRPAEDQRKDAIIKYELFNNFVRSDYDIRLVLEDRDQCVQLWRDLGLNCLQVDYGNF